MGQPLTPDQLRTIIALRQEGQPVQAIADHFGVTQATISMHLRRLPAARIRRACRHCARPFVARRFDQWHCTDGCYARNQSHAPGTPPKFSAFPPEEVVAMKIEREEQGATYAEIATRHHSSAAHIYYLLYGRAPKGVKRHGKGVKRHAKVPRVCAHCGESFLGSTQAHYCSARCKNQSRTDQQPFPSERVRADPCPQCGGPVTGRRFRHCSDGCAKVAARARDRARWLVNPRRPITIPNTL